MVRELAVPMSEPIYAFADFYEHLSPVICMDCGALVLIQELHTQWHAVATEDERV